MKSGFYFENDIPCYRIQASTFPEGVLAAHQALHRHFSFDGTRRFFGISQPAGKGQIIYWAAVEKKEGDVMPADISDEFVIKKGEYYGEEIKNFRKDIPAIGQTFQALLQHPALDPEGYCLEWYIKMEDVICLVPVLKGQI